MFVPIFHCGTGANGVFFVCAHRGMAQPPPSKARSRNIKGLRRRRASKGNYQSNNCIWRGGDAENRRKQRAGRRSLPEMRRRRACMQFPPHRKGYSAAARVRAMRSSLHDKGANYPLKYNIWYLFLFFRSFLYFGVAILFGFIISGIRGGTQPMFSKLNSQGEASA